MCICDTNCLTLSAFRYIYYEHYGVFSFALSGHSSCRPSVSLGMYEEDGIKREVDRPLSFCANSELNTNKNVEMWIVLWQIGLLISRWKQVTQMTTFPISKSPFFYFDGNNLFQAAEEEILEQFYLSYSNSAGRAHIIAWFFAPVLSTLLRRCLAVRCFLMKELRTAEAVKGNGKFAINLAQPDSHLLPKTPAPSTALPPKKTLTASTLQLETHCAPHCLHLHC